MPQVKPSLIIVEDDMVMAMTLEEHVSSWGFKIVAVEGSGEEAVKAARRYLPDLILMDIALPGQIDGIEAARRIRWELGIRSVFLTGHNNDELISRAGETDCLGYLIKPLHLQQIRVTLEIALKTAQRERVFSRWTSGFDTFGQSRGDPVGPETTFGCGPLQGDGRFRGLMDLRAIGLRRKCVLLSPMEIKILTLLIGGMTSKQVGEMLSIAISTVSSHRKSIRKKLGLTGGKKRPLLESVFGFDDTAERA